MNYIPITPIAGQCVPKGAERYHALLGWVKPQGYVFGEPETLCEWRVPEPSVPLSLAVDAVMRNYREPIPNRCSVAVSSVRLRADTAMDLRAKVEAWFLEQLKGGE